MTKTSTPSTTTAADSQRARNEVCLIGRVGAAPQARVLPSGDEVVTLRVVVPRGARERRPPTIDTIDCCGWTVGVRRQLLRFSADDVVEVYGRLRRRFWRAPGGPASRYEVEVTSARRVPGSSSAARTRTDR